MFSHFSSPSLCPFLNPEFWKFFGEFIQFSNNHLENYWEKLETNFWNINLKMRTRRKKDTWPEPKQKVFPFFWWKKAREFRARARQLCGDFRFIGLGEKSSSLWLWMGKRIVKLLRNSTMLRSARARCARSRSLNIKTCPPVVPR